MKKFKFSPGNDVFLMNIILYMLIPVLGLLKMCIQNNNTIM